MEIPSYKFKKIDFASNLDNYWRMDYNKLKVNEDSVILCEIKYSKFPKSSDISVLYILSNGEIIYVEDGMFFFLKKE